MTKNQVIPRNFKATNRIFYKMSRFREIFFHMVGNIQANEMQLEKRLKSHENFFSVGRQTYANILKYR